MVHLGPHHLSMITTEGKGEKDTLNKKKTNGMESARSRRSFMVMIPSSYYSKA